MISDIKNGEVQFQTTEIQASVTDIKEVNQVELCNMDMNNPSVMALGFDSTVVMRILSDSMYKNKLISLQEIPANSRDGIVRRIELGDKDFKPEIVIKYDSTSKELSIKDNGVGMEKEHIVNVYRVYGHSDKRNETSSVGMFGIGSKSPFALVDEYEVSTISMQTHKRLSFIVAKRGIIITEDEIPTDEECGTTVKFTIPKTYSSYDIKNRIKDTVRTWLCPVYFIEDNSTYREMLSYNAGLVKLSDIKNGYYKGLVDNKLKYDNPDMFSFYFKESGESQVFIGHIPYSFEIDLPIKMDVIIHNPNLITLTATREGLEKDTKYNEFTKQVKLKTLEILKIHFDKYFKNLPSNLKDMKGMDELLVQFFNKLSYDNLVNKKDYPYLDILNTAYKFYTISHNNTKTLWKILKNYNTYYVTKKLVSATATELLSQLPPVSAVISCPDVCSKLCIFCPEYDINYDCLKSKEPMSLLMNIVKPVTIRVHTGERAIYQGGIIGTIIRSKKTIRISHSDKHHYKYVKTSFATDDSSIVLVTNKNFNKLKSEGFNVIEDIDAYNTQNIAETYLEDIDGVKISAALLKNYKEIIYDIYDTHTLELIKLLYPKALILRDIIPDSILKTKTESQKILSLYDVKRILRDSNARFKFQLELPAYLFMDRLSVFDSKDIKVSNIEIVKPDVKIE